MNDLDELEAMAKAATPGPWEWVDYGSRMVVPGTTRKGDGKPKRDRRRDRPVISVEPDGACGDPECCPQTESLRVGDGDRAFIAACDPDTILALIARVRRAEARAERLEKALRADAAIRHEWMEAWGLLTRDVAPLIAAFRDTPAQVTRDQIDRALDGMARMQRVEAQVGVNYFDRQAALASDGTEVEK